MKINQIQFILIKKKETRGGFVASKDWKITFKNNFFSVKQDLTDKIRKSPISK